MLVAKGGALSAGCVELPITRIEDVVLAALEPRLRGDIADRALQPFGIVVRDVASCHAETVLQGKRHARPEAC